jgi:hypothetical protein
VVRVVYRVSLYICQYGYLLEIGNNVKQHEGFFVDIGENTKGDATSERNRQSLVV